MDQGYVTDATYADKFHRELSPTWLNYVITINGAQPKNLDQPFAYLELGCGFGQSIITNASAFSHAEFHACDFNPQHIEHGRKLANDFHISNLTFHQTAFENLLTQNLPAFDFIVLHGVYSWVSSETREEIRNIIQKKLKPNGIVYLSYNCLPGWTTEIPLRKLLCELATTEKGNAAQRSQQALATMQTLSDKLRYFNENPSISAAIKSYSNSSSNYLAHEFLNQSWETFYAVDIADQMAAIQLQYIGSATLVDNHPMLMLDEQAMSAISSLPTERQRQLAVDFAVNKRFRRDVFMHNPKKLSQVEISHHIEDIMIGYIDNSNQISTKVTVPRGILTFKEDFISLLRGLLSNGPMSIRDITVQLNNSNNHEIEIIRNLIFLTAAGILMPFSKEVTCYS